MASAVARHGRRGWRLDKANRADKIDAVVALAMALDRVEDQPGTDPADGLAVKRPCLRCGALTDGSYCREHDPVDPWTPQSRNCGRGCSRPTGAAVLDCGRSDVPFEVHHVNGDPMDNRIANTIPLCRDCHHTATFPGI